MRVAAVLAAAVLAGCSLPPPPSPLIALPGPTKTPEQFSQDDIACRVALATIPPAEGEASQPASPPDLPPGAAYLRCMQNRGNLIQPAFVAQPRPDYPVGAYGGDYYPWVYNDSVSFGSRR